MLFGCYMTDMFWIFLEWVGKRWKKSRVDPCFYTPFLSWMLWSSPAPASLNVLWGPDLLGEAKRGVPNGELFDVDETTCRSFCCGKEKKDFSAKEIPLTRVTIEIIYPRRLYYIIIWCNMRMNTSSFLWENKPPVHCTPPLLHLPESRSAARKARSVKFLSNSEASETSQRATKTSVNLRKHRKTKRRQGHRRTPIPGTSNLL